ncbi:MAG TPA: hypothetical protein VFX59_25390 [Polyangiales bacterium]|nr:hypothetical protein [Polyangiales bacterium]
MVVDIVYSHFDDPVKPEVEYEGKRYALNLVDPIRNAQRERQPRQPHTAASAPPVSFDPSRTTQAADDEEDFDATF